MAGRLSLKVVIVTGGSTGIGRAVADRVVAEGGAVVIAGRRREPGERAGAELRASGARARVNALVTGNVDTPLYRDLIGASPDGVLPEPAPNPTGRVAAAGEIGSYVAYLLSDEAAFITGVALGIDGAATA